MTDDEKREGEKPDASEWLSAQFGADASDDAAASDGASKGDASKEEASPDDESRADAQTPAEPTAGEPRLPSAESFFAPRIQPSAPPPLVEPPTVTESMAGVDFSGPIELPPPVSLPEPPAPPAPPVAAAPWAPVPSVLPPGAVPRGGAPRAGVPGDPGPDETASPAGDAGPGGAVPGGVTPPAVPAPGEQSFVWGLRPGGGGAHHDASEEVPGREPQQPEPEPVPQEPEPTQAYTVEPEPTQAYTVEPEPTQAYTVEPEPTQAYAVEPELTQVFRPEPTEATPAPTSAGDVTALFGAAALPETEAAPARPRRARRSTAGARFTRSQRILLWVAGVLLAAIALVALYVLGTRLPALLGSAPAPTPSPTQTTTPSPTPTPEPLAVGPLAPGEYEWDELLGGECLDPFGSPWDELFTVVDCAAPHPAQLVHRGTFASDDDPAGYPGVDALQAQINLLCTAPTVIDLGVAGQFPDVQVQASYAAEEEEWVAGHRDFYCFATRSSGEPLTASIAMPQPAPAA